MGFIDFFRREERAEAVSVDALLQAVMDSIEADREMALQLPAVSGAIDLIGGIIAGTPLKLYTEKDGKAEEVQGDVRVRLLNDETGDTLSANEFWRAMVRDYYLGKGGFAYIHRQGGRIVSIHHVDERQITVQKNADPIFKRHDIFVQGQRFHPHQFLTILRNTRDGMTGRSIVEENPRLIEAAYAMLIYERNLTRRGGNKKGFLKSEKTLAKEALDTLRAGFRRMYSTDGEGSDNFVVLNSGVDFKESSSTPMEMQLRENKAAFAEDFARIFHLPKEALTGVSTDTAAIAKLCIIPLMTVIQCSLNRALLLESEKSSHYFAFDTKELLKGDIQSRYAAYKMALEANFMGIDEVRYAEDLEPLGVSWIRLGLQDVLYDPKTKQLYTPNTDKTAMVGGRMLPEGESGEESEERANQYRDEASGRYTFGPGGPKGSETSLTNAAGQPIIETDRVDPYKGPANGIIQIRNSAGGIDRNYFDQNGRQTRQISNHHHGNPKTHPYGQQGEHAHDYIYDSEGVLVDRPRRNLTEEERKENGDIL